MWLSLFPLLPPPTPSTERSPEPPVCFPDVSVPKSCSRLHLNGHAVPFWEVGQVGGGAGAEGQVGGGSWRSGQSADLSTARSVTKDRKKGILSRFCIKWDKSARRGLSFLHGDTRLDLFVVFFYYYFSLQHYGIHKNTLCHTGQTNKTDTVEKPTAVAILPTTSPIFHLFNRKRCHKSEL